MERNQNGLSNEKRGTCTSRTTDPVDVLLDRVGQLVVDDRLHAADVQPTRGHVRRQQHVDLLLLELLESVQPRSLRHVTVKLAHPHPEEAE